MQLRHGWTWETRSSNTIDHNNHPDTHPHFTDKETEARRWRLVQGPSWEGTQVPAVQVPSSRGANSPAPEDAERQGRQASSQSHLGLGWAGGPQALRVGVGRGKAVNWFGAVGLSCRCRWPLPLSSCVTEECSSGLDKGSFVRRPQEGGGGG